MLFIPYWSFLEIDYLNAIIIKLYITLLYYVRLRQILQGLYLHSPVPVHWKNQHRICSFHLQKSQAGQLLQEKTFVFRPVDNGWVL